jgi:hypothetical protein
MAQVAPTAYPGGVGSGRDMAEALGPKDFIEIGAGLALGAVSAVVLLARRYAFKPKTWTFAGVEYDIARFKDLTQVEFFAHVTKMALPVSSAPLNVPDPTDPAAIIYAGWSLVCDSFVRAFHTYPTDENVRAQVGQLGAQNVDFIIGYRKISESAASNAKRIPLDFAEEYATRAPSLAQRILPADWSPGETLAAELLRDG